MGSLLGDFIRDATSAFGRKILAVVLLVLSLVGYFLAATLSLAYFEQMLPLVGWPIVLSGLMFLGYNIWPGPRLAWGCVMAIAGAAIAFLLQLLASEYADVVAGGAAVISLMTLWIGSGGPLRQESRPQKVESRRRRRRRRRRSPNEETASSSTSDARAH